MKAGYPVAAEGFQGRVLALHHSQGFQRLDRWPAVNCAVHNHQTHKSTVCLADLYCYC